MTLHYTTLHYTTLHYTTLHYTTLHYTTLHYITLPTARAHKAKRRARAYCVFLHDCVTEAVSFQVASRGRTARPLLPVLCAWSFGRQCLQLLVTLRWLRRVFFLRHKEKESFGDFRVDSATSDCNLNGHFDGETLFLVMLRRSDR